jgi:hypothetical protein
VGTDLLGFNPYTMLADIRAGFLVMLGRVPEGLSGSRKQSSEPARIMTFSCSASHVLTMAAWAQT